MTRKSLFIWATGLLLALAAGADDLARRIDEYVRPLAEAGELSGTLLVARDGAVVYERAFGMADYELGVANTPATRHCVASLNKPMTMIIALRLMEQKKLGYGDTLAKWIPGFPRGSEITMEHLLRHRAGIPHRVTEEHERAVPRTAADVVELAKRHELLFKPGERSVYSSGGYSVLARVLELAGGRSYAELLEEHVLAPAGAVHTVSPGGYGLLPGRASSYMRGPAGPLNTPLRDLSFLVGAGAVFSTPRDILAIQQALLKGAYGESARLSLAGDGKLDWTGLTNGYRAFADHHPDRKLTVIFAGNLFTGAADLLRRDIPKLAAGETVAAPQVPKAEPAAVPAALRGKYEGKYQVPTGPEPLRFEPDGKLAWLGEWLLIPTGDDTFYSPQDYATVKVKVGQGGAVEGLDWKTADGAFTLPRVE